MGRAQEDTIFIFDEPTIGLHPLDVRTLLAAIRALVDHGATLIVIEHDRRHTECRLHHRHGPGAA